jgi:hypothetical protein
MAIQPQASSMFDIVKTLTILPGPIGYEQPVQDFLSERWAGKAERVWQTPIGNLFARVGGQGPRLLVGGHADEICLMIKAISAFVHRSSSLLGDRGRVSRSGGRITRPLCCRAGLDAPSDHRFDRVSGPRCQPVPTSSGNDDCSETQKPAHTMASTPSTPPEGGQIGAQQAEQRLGGIDVDVTARILPHSVGDHPMTVARRVQEVVNVVLVGVDCCPLLHPTFQQGPKGPLL